MLLVVLDDRQLVDFGKVPAKSLGFVLVHGPAYLAGVVATLSDELSETGLVVLNRHLVDVCQMAFDAAPIERLERGGL